MSDETTESDEATIYDLVGGTPFFERLTAAFYRRVAQDEKLRALYPEEDLGPAEERLRLFLIQYWGGPHTYNEQRGHPRLRMRHAPYRVDIDMRDRWLAHMEAALKEQEVHPLIAEAMWKYFTMAAISMVNVPEGVDPVEQHFSQALNEEGR